MILSLIGAAIALFVVAGTIVWAGLDNGVHALDPLELDRLGGNLRRSMNTDPTQADQE